MRKHNILALKAPVILFFWFLESHGNSVASLYEP